MQDFDPPRGAFDHGYPYWQRKDCMLKPLGHRVLIRPDEQPEQSEGGLVLPQDHDHVSFSGTVVAVGKGSEREARIRDTAVRMCQEIAGNFLAKDLLGEALVQMLATVSRRAVVEQAVSVGDRVAFSAESGAVFTEDGQQYLVMNEDDVVVLVEEGESAA